jgi:hypothetical protein
MALWLWAYFMRIFACRIVRLDERATCRPTALPEVITPAEADALIAATEHAANMRGGYTTRRHDDFATTDLPLATVLRAAGAADGAALNATVMRALDEAIFPALQKHCGAAAADLLVLDGFVIRYDALGQPALTQHTDGSRFSSTIVLSRGDRHGRTALPPGAKSEMGGGRTAPRPYCEPTCRGDTCDAWVREGGFACSELEGDWGCDCAWCAACHTSPVRNNGAAEFQGGGTRFENLANVTFFPPKGGALVHGGKARHGAEPVTGGRRYVLAFFLEEAKCVAADKAIERLLLVAAVTAFVAVLGYVVLYADFDSEEAAAAGGEGGGSGSSGKSGVEKGGGGASTSSGARSGITRG